MNPVSLVFAEVFGFLGDAGTHLGMLAEIVEEGCRAAFQRPDNEKKLIRFYRWPPRRLSSEFYFARDYLTVRQRPWEVGLGWAGLRVLLNLPRDHRKTPLSTGVVTGNITRSPRATCRHSRGYLRVAGGCVELV